MTKSFLPIALCTIALLLAQSSGGVLADRWVCRVDRVQAITTNLDPGAREEWRFRDDVAIYTGEGTKTKKPGSKHGIFSLKNQNGGACDPFDNVSNGGYACNILFDNSRVKHAWCIDTDETDLFTYGFDFQIGDFDSGFDNGPTWGDIKVTVDLDDMPSNIGATWTKFHTKSGPEGRRGRIFVECWKEAGSCDAIGYKHDGQETRAGFYDISGSGRDEGENCSIFAPCRDDLYCTFSLGFSGTCEPYRQPGEECDITNPCIAGHTCLGNRVCVPKNCGDLGGSVNFEDIAGAFGPYIEDIQSTITSEDDNGLEIIEDMLGDEDVIGLVSQFTGTAGELCAGLPMTSYLGVGTDISVVGGAGVSVGIFANNQHVGGYLTYCWSVGAAIGGGVSYLAGLMTTNDIDQIAGDSSAYDFGVEFLEGISISVHPSTDIFEVEWSNGPGIEFNMFAHNWCRTHVLTV